MLLLFGIPVYVWMKWRQQPRRQSRPIEDFAARSCRREYAAG